ncbi:MAG: TIGR04540 family protein [Clostridium sp.]
MRAVYRNPRELATVLKDLVDTYHEDLLSYEKLEEKVIKIVEANGVYKDGNMSLKVANIIGKEREEEINKIVNK